MIVVDTSVLVAIIKQEPDGHDWKALISRRDDLALPGSCYLEATMVLRARADGRAQVDELVKTYAIELLGSDARQARIAAEAFERFGRGTGHPAKLNFGDCLSYAAAAARGAPLLFKGDDFIHTDVSRVA